MSNRYFLFLLAFLAFCCSGEAKIVRVTVGTAIQYFEGRSFGNAGPYERIAGRAYGEVDPSNPLNSLIQDIQNAPRNTRGMVEYVSDFVILKPADMTKSNGLLFLSLPNRGIMLPPDTALLNRGYVYLWCAWQGDVLDGGSRLTMKVPVATENGKEITGIVRTEFQVSEITGTLDLNGGFFTGKTHQSYETVSLNNKGLTLTKRVLESDPRVPVPNSDWAFSDCSRRPFPGAPDATKISLAEGFRPNYIYELIYTAKDPLVLGLGFAAIRDIASFLRHDLKDESGNLNPLTGKNAKVSPIKAAVLQGVSQCSNFCRTFLFLGFNQDEKGLKVFDGVNAHIGTRRISLNVRFGRPGGGGLQHEDHLFPANDPPFTWDTVFDPISGVTGGILERCIATGTCPKVIQTLSSSEYWQLRASLTTTDSYGREDLKMPENVRVYFFTGTQHTPGDWKDPLSGFLQNYNSYTPYHRAVIIALEKWILNGKQPPVSKYPTIASGTLTAANKQSINWPDIPDVIYNGRVNELPLLDYGPLYDYKNVTGILLQEPPKVASDQSYKTLVPRVDEDGNEIAGIRGVNLKVPLGTYTGWALRKEGFGKGDLSSLNGMFIPFLKTRDERISAGDPRLSLQERYGSHKGYVKAVRSAAKELVKEGFLLFEDASKEIENAEKSDVLKNR